MHVVARPSVGGGSAGVGLFQGATGTDFRPAPCRRGSSEVGSRQRRWPEPLNHLIFQCISRRSMMIAVFLCHVLRQSVGYRPLISISRDGAVRKQGRVTSAGITVTESRATSPSTTLSRSKRRPLPYWCRRPDTGPNSAEIL